MGTGPSSLRMAGPGCGAARCGAVRGGEGGIRTHGDLGLSGFQVPPCATNESFIRGRIDGDRQVDGGSRGNGATRPLEHQDDARPLLARRPVAPPRGGGPDGGRARLTADPSRRQELVPAVSAHCGCDLHIFGAARANLRRGDRGRRRWQRPLIRDGQRAGWTNARSEQTDGDNASNTGPTLCPRLGGDDVPNSGEAGGFGPVGLRCICLRPPRIGTDEDGRSAANEVR